MKNNLKSFLVFIIAAILSISCMQPAQSQDAKRNIAVDFQLQDLNSNTYSLSSYRNNKAVVLFFWTTWCPYCRKELKALNVKYSQLMDAGYELLAISVGENQGKVSSFTKSFNLNFKVLLDKDSRVAYSYGILGVPTFIFINKSGEVVFSGNHFPENRLGEFNQ